jgi:protein gp37
MAENSKIEWTDHTFNPWIGCTKVSPGCDHCYAEARMDTRLHRVHWGAGEPRQRTKTWADPKRWDKAHEAFYATHGRRQRVFCASLADVFDNQVPETWRIDLFALIEETPHLDWLLLTKRIGNAAGMLPWGPCSPPWPNVWLGATVVNQDEADRDIPKLLATPARVRFLSMEPLLGPVDVFSDMTGELLITSGNEYDPGRIDWVIAGGESGHGARPMHPDWARSLRDQCAAAGVPFLFKQWGEWLPWTQFCDARVDDPPEQTRFDTREWIDGAWSDVGRPDVWASRDGHIDDMQCTGRVGKKAAGRLLDGSSHDDFPEALP